MLFKASHSAIKLALELGRLSTFTATIISSSRIPLYTDPELPAPIKFREENPSVALRRSPYDTFKCEHSDIEVELTLPSLDR
jgi:hypothetical protein